MGSRSFVLRAVAFAFLTACSSSPGPQGEAGPQGPAGQTGPQGPSGQPGAAGAPGAEGLRTLVMTTAEQPGTSCATGGVRLVVGADANRNGALDDAEIDSTLTRFVCNGPQGLKGDKGDTGAVGTDGLSTLVATTDELPGSNCATGGTRMQVGRDANRNGTLDDAEVESSHTRYVCNGTQGAKGDMGIQGVKGDKGDKGDTGTQGPKGDQGDTGIQGMKGDKGDTGVQGPKGDKGDTGLQGLKGDKGDTGATGAQGPKGDKGDTGLQGLKGDTGATGAQGPKGDKGDTGTMGPQGPQGPMGPMAPPGVYTRTVVVNPGATEAESGNALRTAIASITDGRTWLVKVEPGVYDLGASGLFLKPGIHLQGSGENATVLRAAINSNVQATVVGASGSVLSSLSVENTGAGATSIAVYSEAADFDFHDVTVTARGGDSMSIGIYLKGTRGTFERVRALGFSPDYANGFRCRDCIASLVESYAEARGGNLSVGVYSAGGSVYLRNVTANAIGAVDNWGVYTDGDMSLVNVEAIGTAGTRSTGFFVGEGNASVRNSVLSASGAMEANEGLASYTGGTVIRTITVQNSVITGETASVVRARSFDVRIGQSQLSGLILQSSVAGAGKLTCVGTYDGEFNSIMCPMAP